MPLSPHSSQTQHVSLYIFKQNCYGSFMQWKCCVLQFKKHLRKPSKTRELGWGGRGNKLEQVPPHTSDSENHSKQFCAGMKYKNVLFIDVLPMCSPVEFIPLYQKKISQWPHSHHLLHTPGSFQNVSEENAFQLSPALILRLRCKHNNAKRTKLLP